MKRLRAVFLGEPNSTFSRLHYAVLERECEIVLWVSGASSRVSTNTSRAAFRSVSEWLRRAWGRAEFEWRSLVTLFILPARIRLVCPIQTMTRDSNALAEQLRQVAPDIIISAGMSRLAPLQVLSTARLGAFNCHPSPLPRYAGSNPWFWMLKCGERQGSVTIHKMVAEADAGEIAAQTSFSIPSDANHQWLYNMSSVYSAKLLQVSVDSWRRGKVEFWPQNLDERTFFPAPRHQDYQIRWDEPWETIRNLWRASSPAPGVWGEVNGQPVHFSTLQARRNDKLAAPGTVVHQTNDTFTIACRDRLLYLRSGQAN